MCEYINISRLVGLFFFCESVDGCDIYLFAIVSVIPCIYLRVCPHVLEL